MLKSWYAWLLVAGIGSAVYAQEPVENRAASLPTNWQRVGSVWAAPDQPALTTTVASGTVAPEKIMWVGTAGQPLELAMVANDFQLTMEVLTGAGAAVNLALPGGKVVKLTGWPVSKMPGLWQRVAIQYRMGKPAMIEKMALNDVTVAEGTFLPGQSTGAQTDPNRLGVQVVNGMAAVRHVVYKPYANRAVAQWSAPLSYTIYEGENTTRAETAGKKILKQDTTARLNYEVGYGQPRRHSVLFSGKLNALKTGDYEFDLNYGGIAGLWVDGKETIPATYHELGQPVTVRLPLAAGPHEVQVFFTRFWARPGLGLFVAQAGVRPQPLHTLISLPDPDPVGLISVQAGAKAERIRSFVQLSGETKKRTHSLSVGTPANLNYTLDLNQMALLQVWKGDFANLTEMWYERGEPQLLNPMGAVVYLPGQTALMVLPNAASQTTAWPDSTDETTLQYRGLTVDKQGYPTIQYTLAGLAVTDDIRPGNNVLMRTLTVKGSTAGTPHCRIVAGSLVEEISKGFYAVNDRSYYIRIDPKMTVKVRQLAGKQEVLLPVLMNSQTGSVQYSIEF